MSLVRLDRHAIPAAPGEVRAFLVVRNEMLRLPDNTDISAPARLTSATTIEATFAALPPGPNQMFLVRIVYEAGGRLAAQNQPVAAYTWSK